MTDTKSEYIPPEKQEREMVQIEMYTEYLDEYSDSFISALNFELIEKNPDGDKLDTQPTLILCYFPCEEPIRR